MPNAHKGLLSVKRPNILFILLDDFGWKDLSCYGSTFYETPTLDGLARDGVRFTDAYAACPVCSPTRASILSGKYPARIGVTDWIGASAKGLLLDAPYVNHLPLSEVAIPKALKEFGYRTYFVGKWHLGGEEYWPAKHGFDVNIGGSEWGCPIQGYFSPYGLPNLSDGPDGEYLTDRLTDEAIGLLRTNGDVPFFMYFSHYAVHNPLQVPSEYIHKYEQKALHLGLDGVEALVEGEYFPCEHKKNLRISRRTIQSNPVYAGMIENLDQNSGRLLQALDEVGMADNTIIIFTSDNGGLATSEGSPTCNSPLSEGKGWAYDGGVREPLIVTWPGVTKSGSVCRVPVTSPDFYPTILQMAGLPLMPEQHIDGASLVPLLAGTGEIEREAIFWHYPHYGNQGGTPYSAVRCGDYKLIEFFEDGRLELYNLAEDIGETRNIASSQPHTVSRLSQMLKDWRIEVGARIPLPNPDYVPWG